MNHNNNIDKTIFMLGLGLLAATGHPVAAAVLGAKAIIKVKKGHKFAR